jgi:RHS repeat-associated protein
VPNSGLMSDFTLYYNSTDGYSGVLGDGWTHTYNVFISTDPTDDAYILSDGHGGMISLYRNGDYYTSDISVYPFLQVNANSTFTLTYKNGTIYSFNTSGRLTAMADKNGNTVHLAYSSGGNLVNISDPTGKTIYLSYNANNRISAINDPNNNSYSFTYSGDTLTQISSHNSLGTQTWRYTYDENGFMLTKTDPQNNLVQYFYDEERRVSQTIDPQGGTINVQYDPENNKTTVTEKDGGAWIYRYDPVLGALKSKTDPAGGTTFYQYDANRNLTSKIEPDGSATEYTYDDYGNMTSATDAAGNTTTYTYNDDNLVTSITDSLGRQTKYTYDADGNILSTTDPAGAITQYTYDSRGNIISITAPNGGVTQMAYDANNNLISITDPGGQTTTQAYDRVGNMINQTDAAGNTTTFQYNSLNQLIIVTDSAGKTTRYTYDANGNRLSVTDANGNTTTYDYNYRNQLIQTTDAAGFRTSFSYGTGGCSTCADGGDRLIALTDARDNTTTYQYDQTGRLMKETDPLGNATTYEYDAKGNMISKTKPDGRTISYYYDELNRLVKRKYPDNTSDIFQYDASGNMTVATNSNIAYYYSYDVNNRITDVTVYDLANLYTISYQYDTMGNRTMMTTPDGKTINYSYNTNNQMTKITSDMGSFTFAYDSLGRRIKRTLPNDSYTTYAYDPLSRLTGIKHINAFNQTIDSFAYTHDNVGNRLTKSDSNKNINYNYDQIYRLTKASPKSRTTAQLPEDIVNHHSEGYSYDAVGNRQTGPQASNWTYNANNELLSLSGSTGQSSSTTYQYDANGNLIKKTETLPGLIKTTSVTAYSYDDENRLTAVKIQQGKKIKEVTFIYDPFGRRISKTIEKDELNDDNSTNKKDYPKTTFFIYDEQNIIAEYDQTGKQTATYIHGPNIDEPLAAEIRNTRIYYHADGLGSITTLTNHMGHKVQQYQYDSFGNIKSTPYWIKQPYTYTAREFDYEMGLYYYRARYYDPKAGRFITKDPLKLRGGINQYAYVGNNPIKWRDPYGLFGPGGFGTQYLGHKDFYGSNMFDYYLEDRELSTSPIPILGDPERHFRDLSISESQIQAAVNTCTKEDFQSAAHRGQDFFSHYDKGYRWDPFGQWNNLGLGHAFAGSTPDNDVYAWKRANTWTLKWLNEWINRCACKE